MNWLRGILKRILKNSITNSNEKCFKNTFIQLIIHGFNINDLFPGYPLSRV